MRSMRLLGTCLFVLSASALAACQGGAVVGSSGPPPVVTTSSSPMSGSSPTATPAGAASATPTPSASPTATATGTTTTSEKLYIVNHGQLGDNPSVTILAATATGQATPLSQIIGSNTLIAQPYFDAVDAKGTLYVSNASNAPISATAGYITEYDAGNQSGNVIPSRTITGLPNPQGLAIDSAGNLVVAMVDKIEVFAPGASGAATPLRTISGSNTTLQNLFLGGQPAGLALDAAGDTYVSMGPVILEFGPAASGNVAPINVYGGVGGSNPATTGPPYGSAVLASAMGVAVDASNNLYAANFNNSTFAIFASPSVPGVTVPSLTASMPFGIFIDSGGAIYVASYKNSEVLVYSSMATFIAGVGTTITSTASGSINYPYGVTAR